MNSELQSGLTGICYSRIENTYGLKTLIWVYKSSRKNVCVPHQVKEGECSLSRCLAVEVSEVWESARMDALIIAVTTKQPAA